MDIKVSFLQVNFSFALSYRGKANEKKHCILYNRFFLVGPIHVINIFITGKSRTYTHLLLSKNYKRWFSDTKNPRLSPSKIAYWTVSKFITFLSYIDGLLDGLQLGMYVTIFYDTTLKIDIQSYVSLKIFDKGNLWRDPPFKLTEVDIIRKMESNNC